MQLRRFPFTIREVLLVTLAVALVLMLAYERSRLRAVQSQLDDLQSPHVWVWAPETFHSKIPIGGSVGVGGNFYYSDKQQYKLPITATVRMIDAATSKVIAEFPDTPTVGVPGRRSFSANFNSKTYGKDIQPGIYVFLVVMFEGEKEIARGSSTVELYHWLSK